MNEETINLLREWVKAEIEYAIASNEEDSSGYRVSALGERNVADRLFGELKTKLMELYP